MLLPELCMRESRLLFFQLPSMPHSPLIIDIMLPLQKSDKMKRSTVEEEGIECKRLLTPKTLIYNLMTLTHWPSSVAEKKIGVGGGDDGDVGEVGGDSDGDVGGLG